jgi:hypothetical protein
MKRMHCDLPDDERNQQRKENGRSDEVAQIQRHRDGAAEGLSKRCSGDLNDPENERDFGNFASLLLSRIYDWQYCPRDERDLGLRASGAILCELSIGGT